MVTALMPAMEPVLGHCPARERRGAGRGARGAPGSHPSPDRRSKPWAADAPRPPDPAAPCEEIVEKADEQARALCTLRVER